MIHLHRKVSQWQSADGSCTTTGPTSGAVVTNEQLCKLDAIVLDVGECRVAELLEKYVCVCDGNIQQEIEDVLIELPTLCPAAVVPSFLIPLPPCTYYTG